MNHRHAVLVSSAFGLVALGIACGSSGDSSTFTGTDPVNSSGANGSSSFGASSGGDGSVNVGEGGPASACGNGVKNADTEICDDGNKNSGDGCSSTCRVEAGWICTTPGLPCVAIKCGDGVVAGTEDCDDGNNADGDGCNSKCQFEENFKCPPTGGACTPTVCGDNKKEGTEQCDDGNHDPFDGCDPDCRLEPVCANGTCTAVCGDGLKFGAEECDDGNIRNGDGCSSDCKKEAGFVCADTTAPAPTTKNLYIAYRDFKAAESAGGHSDFLKRPEFQNNAIDTVAQNLVNASLDMQGRPVFNPTPGGNAAKAGIGTQKAGEPLAPTLRIITDATSFSSWYRDTAFSKKYVSKLPLTRAGAGNAGDPYTYGFSSSSFFPFDNDPFTGAAAPAANQWPEKWSQDNFPPTTANSGGNLKNFLFTSELRIPFKYKGGETLKFTGDDDVWVFVNGKLASDLGGVKQARTDQITLDTATVNAKGLGLVMGGLYEFVVFQAERNPTASNYQLTIGDFDRVVTACNSVCGDGVKTPDEVCDDGTANNTGAYGKCAPDCSMRGPFCGDGIVQADKGEQCDSTPGCSADCRTAENTPH